jgi:hypothetical protein
MEAKMDKQDLRLQNLDGLRTVLKKIRHATKPQLATAASLSVVTVNALLKELLTRNEVLIEREAVSSGGRPAQQYCFNGNHKLALAVYMHEKNGRDMMFVSVENLFGDTLQLDELQPTKINLQFFVDILLPYFEQYPQISVVVIGLPGAEVKGKLVVVDYPELKDTMFCQWLGAKLGCPVYFENDINAAVAGYAYALGAAKDEETIIGIYFPQNYPPGAGIFEQGKLYKGRDGMAGEIGYRLSDKEYDMSRGITAAASETVLLFVRTWNPHRIVIYHESLEKGQILTIKNRCCEEIAADFLPEIIIQNDIYEDYARGIRRLAGVYLNKKEK